MMIAHAFIKMHRLLYVAICVLQIPVEEGSLREWTSKLTSYTTIISSPLQQSATGCVQSGRNLRERGTLGVSGIPMESVESGFLNIMQHTSAESFIHTSS